MPAPTANTILVVDDSPTELRLLTDPLKTKGYTVITAVDGDEAIQKACALLPKLMLLDVIMPKKNGFQVCRQLKNSPETKNIKIIIISSKSQESDKFWGMKQGADEYMVKPFDEKTLLANVAKFM
ncbi:MAG: response regulator [Deltaproteobacteria bacterium]|nr:response regulator [Deltaproteobacteria bacterium]